MSPFGILSRSERLRKGISLRAMADDLGISPPYLSQLETGTRPLTAAVVEDIIEFYQAQPEIALKMRVAATKSLPKYCENIIFSLNKSGISFEDREIIFGFMLYFDRLSRESKQGIRSTIMDSIQVC